MYIGNVKIDNKALLAPMAGVADTAFRLLCKEFGAALVYTEMASAKGLIMKNEKTNDIMSIKASERPVALQLFGDEADTLKKAACIIQEKFKPDIIDLNFGCPAHKIAENGDGAALMKDPEKAAEIVRAVKSVCSVPLTVKFRRGWDDKSINAVEFGMLMQACGAAAVAVHGRTKMQQYTGNATYDEIKELKQRLSIPVIANGDIFSAEKAKQVLDYTNADMVMVARGAYGNPWIFAQINHYLSTGEKLAEPNIYEKMAVMLVHVEKLVELKGEYLGMRQARKHAAWYIKGINNSASYRRKLSTVEKYSELYKIAEEILKNN